MVMLKSSYYVESVEGLYSNIQIDIEETVIMITLKDNASNSYFMENVIV